MRCVPNKTGAHTIFSKSFMRLSMTQKYVFISVTKVHLSFSYLGRQDFGAISRDTELECSVQ